MARFGIALRRAPLLLAFGAGIAGILVVDSELWISGWLALLTGLITVLFFTPGSHARVAIIAGCLAAALLLGTRHYDRLREIEQFPFAAAVGKGQSIEISGEAWIADTVTYGARSLSTSLRLETIKVGSLDLPCDHRIPAWVQKLPGNLGYGTRLRFTGRLMPLDGPVTPGGFDAKTFYFRQSGSLARLEIREGDKLTILPGSGGSRLVAFSSRLRSRMEAGLLEGLPEADLPYARLIAAMALGARENSPEELEELFRISGTLHLFAVSGMHVGVVAGLLLGLALLLRIPRHVAVLIVIPFILFYAILTGLSPSAVRAALMLTVFLAAYALREKPRLLNSLGFAGLILLLFDSQQLFLPGFQLSFTVVFFIALLTKALHSQLAGPFLADPFLPKSLVPPLRKSLDKATGVIAASAAISISSWIGSAGLLAWHFQSISMVAIIANVFMVPFAGVIISLAALSLAAFGLKFVWITMAANQLNVGIAMALTGLAQFFAGWPGASLNTGEIGRTTTSSQAALRLDVMGDRGEGAALLTIPGSPGAAPLLWMIDTGGSRTYRQQALPLLRSRGINRLDALVLTHGDQGHIGAAPALLSQFRPRLLFESLAENRSPAYPEIRAIAETLDMRVVAMDRGHRLTIGAGVVFTVLSPSGAHPGRLADDRALVLRLTFGGRTLLLTSDAGFHTEKDLLETGADLRADVWIRGQHSEAPSATPAFLNAVDPLAVISSHADFPKSEEIPEAFRNELRDRSIVLFELAKGGHVTLEVEGDLVRIVPFADPSRSISLPTRLR